VHSGAPRWAPGEAWSVDPGPVLVLGGETEDPDQQFSAITSAFRLSDGSIAIADLRLSQILVYSVEGKLLRTMGRKGAGPGEFLTLDVVERIDDDSIAAWDIDGTVVVFDPEGHHVRTREDLKRVRSYGGVTPLADTGLFGWEEGYWVTEGVVRIPRILIRGNVEGARIDTLGVWPGHAVAWAQGDDGEAHGWTVPFTTGSLKAGGGTPWRLVVGTGEEAYLELFDERGHRVKSVSWAARGRPISRSRWEKVLAEGGSQLAAVDPPEFAPVYYALAIDSIGDIWAQHHPFPEDTEDVWTVLDPEGVWLGEVSVPAGCEIKSIGGDYLLCRFRDEMRIERLTMFHLRR